MSDEGDEVSGCKREIGRGGGVGGKDGDGERKADE